MERIFIPLYRFLSRRRWLMYTLLILSSVLFVYFGLKVEYEENIAKLLPQTEKATESGLAFGNLRVKDKIFIQLHARQEGEKQERDNQDKPEDREDLDNPENPESLEDQERPTPPNNQPRDPGGLHPGPGTASADPFRLRALPQHRGSAGGNSLRSGSGCGEYP